jgi:probable F420-dependent oxidoreductase
MPTGQRPFRFGVVGEGIRSGEQLAAEARRAEALGYATLLLRDHFVPEPFGDQLAPTVALMAAAGVTRTLRLGTLVLDNDYRHPVLLAKEAATLDLLSGGRFELGVGAGWLGEEYQRAGMRFDAPGVRVGRLEESLQVLKGLLAGSAFSFSGVHYTVAGLEGFPRPLQRPHPPILVGAGSRRMLGIAGREADIVGILPRALPNGTISEDLSERSPETIDRKVGWVRQAAGERFGELELSMMVTVIVADDHRTAAAQLAAERGWGVAASEQVLEMPSVFVGPVDRIAEAMQARRDRYGFSYYVVSDADMEALGPVVDRLAGR